MRSLSFFVLLGWIAGVCLCQYQYKNPDPTQSDFSQTFENGNVIDITWHKGWKGVGDALKTADLWITWFDDSAFSQLLKSNITFDTDGELKWKANISDANLKHTPRYVFRLKPHTDPPLYSDIQNESPSRGFNLIPSTSNPTSSARASSASSTSSTSTSSTSTTATASTTASASHSSTLGTGAIAGIAVGGAAVLALFALGAWFLLRYRRNANAAGPGGRFEKDGTDVARLEAVDTAYKPPVYAGTYMPVPPPPVEADGHAVAAELYGEGGNGSPRGYR